MTQGRSPYRTMLEAAEYLCLRHDDGSPSAAAACKFLNKPKQQAALQRAGRPLKRVGRELRVHIDGLEAVMDVPRRAVTRHPASSLVSPRESTTSGERRAS